MNIIDMARQASRYASNQTNDSYDWKVIRDERFATLVRAQALEEVADMVSACDPRATPKGIAAAIRVLKEQT